MLVGSIWPDFAKNDWIKALGTGFIKLIKMAIAPIIFLTVVSGISHVRDAAKIGRVALKAVLYFEVISTFALAIGLLVANVIKPGEGMHFAASSSKDAATVASYEEKAAGHSSVDFLLDIIPKTFVSAFSEGVILQVLFLAIVFGFALMFQGDRAQAVTDMVEQSGHVMFGVINIIMRAAPIGAFGAMAHTVGVNGISSLLNLLGLIATFYLTALLFVLVVLGAVAGVTLRVNIFRFLFYLREELLLVLATSSSESALPRLLEKMEACGCPKSVVGLVVPLGYSFNLDGTNIYMTLATLFIAQAMGVQLALSEQMQILLVAMLTSKGASGVSGAGFITLASTLGAVRPELVPGMGLVLGIDKFMSECRSLTNFCGNAVATLVISWSEGQLDREKLQVALGCQKSEQKREACVEGCGDEESAQSTVSTASTASP